MDGEEDRRMDGTTWIRRHFLRIPGRHPDLLLAILLSVLLACRTTPLRASPRGVRSQIGWCGRLGTDDGKTQA